VPERRRTSPGHAADGSGAPPVTPIGEPAAAGDAYFAERGWRAFPFQREVWSAMAAGEHGLLHATTGAGKTYAVWFGALARAPASASRREAPPLGVLWITPMRALAADTLRALQMAAAAVAPHWTLSARTGDTGSAERARQDRRWPTALVTTPESLTLMLTRPLAAQTLSTVHTVIVDEWHELLGSKRGVQVQLAIARLRRWNPALIAWGLSATLGNVPEALNALTGGSPGRIVRGRIDKDLVIDTLLPVEPGRFTWGGHLGAQMRDPVVSEIEASRTTLVFTNVRSQAEIWYQMLLQARPDWAGLVALHHGSLDHDVRAWVEAGLKEGRLKAVVATSSLDLGVDFLPVERVIQIGSPKGVARLLQRAGRSGHAPGRPSRVTVVPTNTLELLEGAAARRAAHAGRVESREPPDRPLDVLVQHLVTCALGGGFQADGLYEEVRGTWSYRALERSSFDWALAFVERGGESLAAYPEYHRVVWASDDNGSMAWRVIDRGIAQRHRLGVGTIVGDATMKVQWQSGGGTLGTIEESFIARLAKGDCFVYAGRVLEFVRSRELVAYVKLAARPKGKVAVWSGSRMSLSSELADAVLALLDEARDGEVDEPEMQAAEPMLRAQARLSRLPSPQQLLAERHVSREGHHLFLYPFAGRHVHLGLAGLLAWRLSQRRPNTWSMAVNDYGFELLAAEEPLLDDLLDGSLWRTDDLLHDVLDSLNARELSQRRFREIARVAGLVSNGYPGQPKALRQLQASSALFYEVFRKYDAGNRLLQQADEEVLAQELELGRLREALKRLADQPLDLVELRVPGPFAVALMVERLRERLTTEKLEARLARMLAAADRQLDRPPRRPGPRTA